MHSIIKSMDSASFRVQAVKLVRLGKDKERTDHYDNGCLKKIPQAMDTN